MSPSEGPSFECHAETSWVSVPGTKTWQWHIDCIIGYHWAILYHWPITIYIIVIIIPIILLLYHWAIILWDNNIMGMIQWYNNNGKYIMGIIINY